MSRDEPSSTAVVGIRVKSGMAIAVLVTVSPEPLVLDRRVLDLCDASVAHSRQPYHASMGTLQTDQAKINRLRGIVEKAAHRSVSAFLDDCRKAGQPVQAAGLVAGSMIDPDSIANPHIRAHALEGQLFRTVVEEALKALGIPSAVFLERELYARAAISLHRKVDEVKRVLAELGRQKKGPWRADEKAACLAGWLVLASRHGGS